MIKSCIHTLDNGLRVVSVEMPHLHSAELAVYLKVGGRNDPPGREGLSHFLEHILFRGTADFTSSLEIENAFEVIGGTPNASTDAESTCFYSRVHPDHYRRGMETLTDYLYSLGHRRLGFVGHHSMLGPINERANVLLESVARYPDVKVQTAADEDGLEGGRRATRALLSADAGLTAIVCVNDFMATGALREIRDRGLRVPEDISVTGFDNVKLAQFCYPALTSVHIPRDQIGQIICDALLPGDKRVEHDVVIDPELVVRESTGPAR